MQQKTVFPMPAPAKGKLKITEKTEVATAIFAHGQGEIEALISRTL
jgi:hypothetical protein